MLQKNEKEALFDVEDRIAMLERRLDNAKAARDAFLHHLRGKYPNWKPPLPARSYQTIDFSNTRSTATYAGNLEPLQSRLATGDYQWDILENRGRNTINMARTSSKFRSNYGIAADIPTSGPLLESDIRRSKIRLREISEELRSMRIDRMSLSTEQWLQEQSFRQHKSLHLTLAIQDPKVDHLEQARTSLSRINLTETSPVDTPTEERKIDMEMSENHEKLLAEMRKEHPPAHVTFSEDVVSPTLPQAPLTLVSSTPEETVEARKVEAPILPPTTAVAAPPSTLSNLLAGIGGISDSDESSPRIPNEIAGISAPKLDYSQFLTSLRGGGTSSSDDEEDNAFSRSTLGKTRPSEQQAKSMASVMFQDDSDVDDFFK